MEIVEEPKKIKKKFDPTKLLYLIIFILSAFIVYQSVTLHFSKVGNTIAVTYYFDFLNNTIDK